MRTGSHFTWRAAHGRHFVIYFAAHGTTRRYVVSGMERSFATANFKNGAAGAAEASGHVTPSQGTAKRPGPVVAFTDVNFRCATGLNFFRVRTWTRVYIRKRKRRRRAPAA